MKQITDERLDRVFDFVVSYKQTNDGVSPNRREIMAACNLGAETVTGIVKALVKNGRVRLIGGQKSARNIAIVGGIGGGDLAFRIMVRYNVVTGAVRANHHERFFAWRDRNCTQFG